MSPLPKGHLPTAVRALDLTGDGIVDLVVPGRNWNGEPDGSGRVTIMRGLGNGVFDPFSEVLVAAGQAESVAVGDLDGDGKTDLVITVSSRHGRVAFAKGLGGGLFDEPTYRDAERQPQGVNLGDVDGDGDLDVAVTNYQSASFQVFRNDFATGAGLVPISTRRLARYLGGTPYPMSAQIADMNGDGTKDVLTTLLGGSRVSLATGASAAPPSLGPNVDWKPANIGNESPAVINSTLADLDGDGDLDVAMPSLFVTQSQKVIVLRNAGNGSFPEQPALDILSFAYAWSSTTIDADGDGRLDLAVGTALPGTVSFLRNQTASPTAPLSFALQPVLVVYGVFVRDMTAVDVDNDGDQDLVGVDIGSDAVFVAKNETPQGGVAGAPRRVPPPRERGGDLPKAPRANPVKADLSGDGTVDATDVAIWLEQGSPSTSTKGGAR
ncbi:MAG: VCBS repeat-containing protein [Phycisphaerae bacterium]|nr:VCBS repeat-containing protein [Phycisphaerae bacterium]